MDILQQSLQAADILSGEDNDIFGELGLTFNNPSTETVELGDDLSSLSQTNTLYSNESKNSEQMTPGCNESSDSSSMSGFDTSQFLNTSAPVNSSQSARHSSFEQQTNEYVKQTNYQSVSGALNPNQIPSRVPPISYSSQREVVGNYTNSSQAIHQHSVQNIAQPTTQTIHQPSMHNIVQPTNAHELHYQPRSKSSNVTSSNNAVFSGFSTQLQQTNVGQRPGTLSMDSAQTTQPTGIRVATSAPFQMNSNNAVDNRTQNIQTNVLRSTTPVQIVQPVAGQQKQLLTVVQKPNNIRVNSPVSQNQPPTQYVNGLGVQPQRNTFNQSQNVAVLRVAGTKQNINISDPQIVKALTANILQKQQAAEVQSGQQHAQQFVNVDQNNSVINVVPHRTQPQVRGTQQITLQNGQTILLNSSQPVQVLHAPTPTQNVASSVSGYSQVARNTLQPSKTGQMPIKGIQIASVNIPIASSTTNTTSVDVVPTANSVLTIPVVAKQDTISNTVTSTNAGIGSTVAAQQINTVARTPKSSTVRSLLVNSIMKQNNNTSVTNSSMSQSGVQQQRATTDAQHVAVPNGQVANSQRAASIGPTLRLNLTPQQASQLTTTQLQTILKQHRATLQARAIANSEAKTVTQPNNVQVQNTAVSSQSTPVKNTQPVSNSLASILRPSVTGSVSGSVSSPVAITRQNHIDQQSLQVFRVDPTLTEAQVDEVKKLLANRTIASKLQQLSREQQQLVLAFQAQIKSMSPPVQQYYLRNPQLFMQKVLQQIRVGKPFILKVKMDSQQNKVKVVSTSQPTKMQHPTISLTQEPHTTQPSTPTRTTVPVPAPPFNKPAQLNAKPFSPVSINQNQTVTPAVDVTVPTPKKAMKRPAPPAKVSLVLEQLECHKKMTTNPDCAHPFRSIRDAIRRLVPFHTCNIPNVEEEHFEESEKIFDKIADRIVNRTQAMVNKYHLLSLRDSTRDSCSAEMVMIERMFLQKEKAKLAEDKARLKENPSLIKEYFPRRSSEEYSTNDLNGVDGSNKSPQKCLRLDKYFKSETDSSGVEQNVPVSPFARRNMPQSASDSDCKTNSERLISYESNSSPGDAKRIKVDLSDTGSQSSSADETLLLEAVDSILP